MTRSLSPGPFTRKLSEEDKKIEKLLQQERQKEIEESSKLQIINFKPKKKNLIKESPKLNHSKTNRNDLTKPRSNLIFLTQQKLQPKLMSSSQCYLPPLPQQLSPIDPIKLKKPKQVKKFRKQEKMNFLSFD